MMQVVSAIIVSHNSDLVLSRCLDALARQTFAVAEIIVVDCDSDDCRYLLPIMAREGVTLVETGNVGFSRANNIGMGLVSGALHQDYRVPGNALTVVASGLYDSIGVYRPVSDKEKRISRQWLAFIGLQEKADIAFKELSWGEQRLVLIARALIKYPALLILDEPTLGLDDQNRLMVLACLERIAGLGVSTMLFVSHRQDEHLDIFRKHLVFEPDKEALFAITFRRP